MNRRSFGSALLGMGLTALGVKLSPKDKLRAILLQNDELGDVFVVSSESLDDIRAWGVNQIDEQTKKEIWAGL